MALLAAERVERTEVAAMELEEIGPETRRKTAVLVARGLPLDTVAKALLLDVPTIERIQQTEEYREKHAEEVLRAAEESADLDGGWDAVETRGLEITLEAMRFSRDPKFALMAALSANRARRRGSQERVLDAAGAGAAQGNLIVLQINKNYANKAQDGALTIEGRIKRDQPLETRVTDVPNPRHVEQMLNVPSARPAIAGTGFVKEVLSQSEVDEFAEMLEGIVQPNE